MPPASERLRPQTPYRGFSPGPHWGTSVPETPSFVESKKILKLHYAGKATVDRVERRRMLIFPFCGLVVSRMWKYG